jgi:hypothetical protein
MLNRYGQPGGGTNFMPSNPELASRFANRPVMQVSEEWLKMDPFGVGQTMSGIAQRQGGLDMLSQGRGPGIQFQQLGGNTPMMGQLQSQADKYRQFLSNDQERLMEAVGMSRNPAAQQSQGGGVKSRLGGAASGAMTGASIGSIIPGIGTGIGAAIGGLFGLFGGGKKKPAAPVAPAIPRINNPYLTSMGGF